MAYGLNTAGNISAFVNTIWDDALLVARENTLASNLVTVFTGSQGTAVRTNATYGTATINTIGDDDDLSSQVFSPSSLSTLTPYEYGAQFFLTDTRIETEPWDTKTNASLELGQALAQSVDKAVLGDFDLLTGGTVGNAGSTITWGYFTAMIARLQANSAPRPWIFVCHPYQYKALAGTAAIGATVTNSPYIQDAVARNYFVQNVMGVDIFVSSNCEQSGGTAGYVAMFSKAALALDIRRAPRLEAERDASRRGIELNISALYAHGVWRPAWGIQGIFASSAPTS